jgi:putative addiction module killer protein/probable addiction module antidote protein
MIELKTYVSPAGKSYFTEWLNKLRDMQARARIDIRLNRVANGLTGDTKFVGEGVSELLIDWAPGYRVYFARTAQPSCYYSAAAINARNKRILTMPSNTGKTTKRAASKIVKTASHKAEKKVAKPAAIAANMLYKPTQHEWLRKDAKHSAAYLEAAIETGDPGDLMAALRDIADAHGGVSHIAKTTGLGRETLYRTLSKKGNPQLSSLIPILEAVGLRLIVAPLKKAA